MFKDEEKKSVAIYYDSLKNFPPLSEKEERILLRRYKKNNDIVARQKLINHNLRYALKYAIEYSNKNNQPIEDTIQLANLGLIEAIEKFDLKNENRITSYANWRMLYSIQSGTEDKVMDNTVDDYNISCIGDLSEDCEDREEEYNGTHDDEDALKEECNIFDSEINTEQLLQVLMSELNEREYDMVTMYFGLNDLQKEYTLDEIGKKYNLTKERVRQIIEKGKRKMRIKALVENKTYE